MEADPDEAALVQAAWSPLRHRRLEPPRIRSLEDRRRLDPVITTLECFMKLTAF